MKQNVVDHFLTALHLTPEEVPGLYATFIRALGECLDQLRAADGNPPDFLAIRRATHTLLGFARNVGAIDLGDAALALNAAAHTSDAAACSLGIRDIESIYSKYRDDPAP